MRHITIAVLAAAILVFAACEHQADAPAAAAEAGELSIRVTAPGFGEDSSPPKGVTQNRARTADTGYTTTFTNGEQIGITVVKEGVILQNNVRCTFNSANGGKWTPATRIFPDADATYLAYFPYSTEMNGKKTAGEIASAFNGPAADQSDPVVDQSNRATYVSADLMIGSGEIDAMTLEVTLEHKMALVEVCLPEGATVIGINMDGIEISTKMLKHTEAAGRSLVMYRYIFKPDDPPGTAVFSGGYLSGGYLVYWKQEVELAEGTCAKVSVTNP